MVERTLGDLDTKVREIKARIENAQRAHARAAHERDAAQAAVDRARQTLKSEYGIETPEDAKRVLASLESELTAAVQEVETFLTGIGA